MHSIMNPSELSFWGKETKNVKLFRFYFVVSRFICKICGYKNRIMWLEVPKTKLIKRKLKYLEKKKEKKRKILIMRKGGGESILQKDS